MIHLQNISLGYDTKRLLLDNVSTTFTCGTTTALIGRNGSGKSTLLRAIVGSEPLKHGAVFINGIDRQGEPFGKDVTNEQCNRSTQSGGRE